VSVVCVGGPWRRGRSGNAGLTIDSAAGVSGRRRREGQLDLRLRFEGFRKSSGRGNLKSDEASEIRIVVVRASSPTSLSSSLLHFRLFALALTENKGPLPAFQAEPEREMIMLSFRILRIRCFPISPWQHPTRQIIPTTFTSSLSRNKPIPPPSAQEQWWIRCSKTSQEEKALRPSTIRRSSATYSQLLARLLVTGEAKTEDRSGRRLYRPKRPEKNSQLKERVDKADTARQTSEERGADTSRCLRTSPAPRPSFLSSTLLHRHL
jgi:hypothetical protein